MRMKMERRHHPQFDIITAPREELYILAALLSEVKTTQNYGFSFQLAKVEHRFAPHALRHCLLCKDDLQIQKGVTFNGK
jgi:hypothetical protein